MSMAWMKMYWGDYLADTTHLSTDEHGAYLLLIARYWQTRQPLPKDHHLLQKVTKLSAHKWKKVWSTISEFFVEDGDILRHPRIDEELNKALKAQEDSAERQSKFRKKKRDNVTRSERDQNTPSDSRTQNPESDSSLRSESGAGEKDQHQSGESAPPALSELEAEILQRLAAISYLRGGSQEAQRRLILADYRQHLSLEDIRDVVRDCQLQGSDRDDLVERLGAAVRSAQQGTGVVVDAFAHRRKAEDYFQEILKDPETSRIIGFGVRLSKIKSYVTQAAARQIRAGEEPRVDLTLQLADEIAGDAPGRMVEGL